MNFSDSKAFSLVELSIVLVILGLLTGGILTGQNLIRAAELRAVTTEFQSYQTAAMTFRDKYFALPGDMRNATDFWEDMTANGGDCLLVAGTTGTCNGNGDGRITVDVLLGMYEAYAFWQHLANAGLIEGRYSGVVDFATVNGTPVTNVPTSKMSNGGWQSHPLDDEANPRHITGDCAFVFDSCPNYLYFAKPEYNRVGADRVTIQAILTPEEAWNIDSKMDDGVPNSGMVQVPTLFRTDATGIGTLAICDDGTSSAYDLNDTTVKCALAFKM